MTTGTNNDPETLAEKRAQRELRYRVMEALEVGGYFLETAGEAIILDVGRGIYVEVLSGRVMVMYTPLDDAADERLGGENADLLLAGFRARYETRDGVRWGAFQRLVVPEPTPDASELWAWLEPQLIDVIAVADSGAD